MTNKKTYSKKTKREPIFVAVLLVLAISYYLHDNGHQNVTVNKEQVTKDLEQNVSKH